LYRFKDMFRVPRLAVEYAVKQQKRLPEAERYILKDPVYAVSYAIKVIKGPWPELEPSLLKTRDPWDLCDYAVHAKKERWPEAEPYILKDTESIVDYVSGVKRGRWPEAESKLMKNPAAAVDYAITVMGERWHAAERYMKRDPEEWVMYVQEFGYLMTPEEIGKDFLDVHRIHPG